MKYDSKTYLYYFLQDNLRIDEPYIKQKINMLSDFYIVPGSLNFIDDDDYNKKYVNGKITLLSDNLETINVKIYLYGIELLLHYKGTTSDINIYIKNGENPELCFNLLNNNFNNNPGLYLFNENTLSVHSCDWHPAYEYFDYETVETLMNQYNLSEEKLLYIDDYSLNKIGFEPDGFSFLKYKDLGYNDSKELLNDILFKFSLDDLVTLINSINKDNKLNSKQKRFK